MEVGCVGGAAARPRHSFRSSPVCWRTSIRSDGEVPGEGLVVRIRVRGVLTAFCLALAGCSAAHEQTAPNAGRPFLGTPTSRTTPHDPSAAPAEVDNLLAGQVIDKAFNRGLANASIQIVDLQDAHASTAARLDVSANGDGYFVIPGLQRGHHYQLIAPARRAITSSAGQRWLCRPIRACRFFSAKTTPRPRRQRPARCTDAARRRSSFAVGRARTAVEGAAGRQRRRRPSAEQNEGRTG